MEIKPKRIQSSRWRLCLVMPKEGKDGHSPKWWMTKHRAPALLRPTRVRHDPVAEGVGAWHRAPLTRQPRESYQRDNWGQGKKITLPLHSQFSSNQLLGRTLRGGREPSPACAGKWWCPTLYVARHVGNPEDCKTGYSGIKRSPSEQKFPYIVQNISRWRKRMAGMHGWDKGKFYQN